MLNAHRFSVIVAHIVGLSTRSLGSKARVLEVAEGLWEALEEFDAGELLFDAIDEIEKHRGVDELKEKLVEKLLELADHILYPKEPIGLAQAA